MGLFTALVKAAALPVAIVKDTVTALVDDKPGTRTIKAAQDLEDEVCP